ncbi:MAG: 50S ribosomal protein L17 [Candidatus Nealsonbacteria bacterium]|nr:50S ribosomal protein L17 [Candidatus Nealsonbacteria bacterium]
MKKIKKGRKLSRKKDQREALLRSLAASLFLREKIQTTLAKAKETSVFASKIITRARKGDLAARRKIAGILPPPILKKVFQEIGPRYKTRPGGYTRIVRIGPRKLDGAEMAIIELVK